MLCLSFIFTGCMKDQITTQEQTPDEPIKRMEIDAQVFELLNKHGEFRWSMVDDHTAWSGLVLSDNMLSIGYKPADVNNTHEIIHEIDINDEKWSAARNQVINTITEILKDDPDFDAEKHIYVKEVLPAMIVHTKSFEVIQKLRQMKDLVRYVEPMGYGIEPDVDHSQDGSIGERSDSGCGDIPAASGIQNGDYTNLPPYNNKVPWTYSRMNIDDAWNQSTGDNITIAMFDTGTSDSQYKLRNGFDDGYSSGRYFSPRSTLYTTTGMWWWSNTTLDTPNDPCGHGTQMSGVIAGPRSSGTAVVGVAHDANLLAYRVTEDVVINASHEKDGVSDAFVQVAQEGNAKIISMSLGDVFSSGQVEDAVIYAYNHGILTFAAAGTSLSWTSWYGVIFPASLSQTVAVTGVTDQTNYSRCEVCHDGSAVDFVVKMERSSTRRSLTLRYSGNTPAWVGGSSIATAHMAGVAGLVWAKNPWYSRSSVLWKLKNASQNYPSRHGSYGWGTVDANAAL